jgi:hypothetical protein
MTTPPATGAVKSSWVPKKKGKRIHFRVEHELEKRPARIVNEPERVYMRNGKLIPLVVLDTNERPDIDSLFAAVSSFACASPTSAAAVTRLTLSRVS